MLAFEAPQFTWLVEPGEKVRMGQPIGYVRYTEEVENIVEVLYPQALEEGLKKIKSAVQEVQVEEIQEEIEEIQIEETQVEEIQVEEIQIEETKETHEEKICIAPSPQTILTEIVQEKNNVDDNQWSLFEQKSERNEEEDEEVWYDCLLKNTNSRENVLFHKNKRNGQEGK